MHDVHHDRRHKMHGVKKWKPVDGHNSKRQDASHDPERYAYVLAITCRHMGLGTVGRGFSLGSTYAY